MGKASEYERKYGFDYVLSNSADSLRDIKRFFDLDDKIKSVVDGAIINMKQVAEIYWSHQKAYISNLPDEIMTSMKPINSRKPVRTYISPINNIFDSIASDNPAKERLAEELINLRSGFSSSYFTELLIQYHINGKNTIGEIINRVLIDSNSENEEFVERYIHLLEEIGLVTIIETAEIGRAHV